MNASPFLVVAVAAALLSGCLQDTEKPQKTTALYADAQEKFASRVDGAEEVEKEFTVPEGKGKLVVFAHYTVDGAADFRLKSPSGQDRHKEEVSGSKTVNNTKWAEIDNPVAGIWHLDIEIAGSATYAFGIYISGEAAPVPELYSDARHRLVNRVDGADTAVKNFDVPTGTNKITVKAKYHVEGTASFTLRDPALTKEDDSISGTEDFADGVWYEAMNPLPGPWRLSLQVSGSADYVFGIYY